MLPRMEGAGTADRLRYASLLARRGALRSAWPLVDAPLRAAAKARLGSLEPDGVSVVTVSYHSKPYLKTLVHAVRRYTARPLDIVVVDNGSQDASREWLRGRPDLRSILLPFNVFHGRALDVGVLSCRTEFVVVLDVDAFPISDAWLSTVVDPLRAGMHVAGGAYTDRAFRYVHPCFLALRTERFVRERLSFVEVRSRRHLLLDTGAAITQREAPLVHFVEPSSVRGPDNLGTVYGSVLYHNYGSTRVGGARWTERRLQTQAAWDDAVAAYLDDQAVLDATTR
jgi:glycosyltransferase involved in cell wall biosynthesis